MKTVTYEEFLEFNSSWAGGTAHVKAYFDRFGGSVSALDILNLNDVSAEDKLWSVLREEFIPAPILHEFACVCAEYALTLIDSPDPRSVKAIEVKRAWMRGEATDEERAAALDAASEAVREAAAWAAPGAWAASEAAGYAASAAASAAARYAAWAASDAAWAACDAAWHTKAASDATCEALAAYLIMALEEEKGKQSLTKNF